MFEFEIEETPNPEAKKYVFGFDIVKSGKKVTFINKEDCEGVPLASTLLDLEGIEKIYFFSNFITVTKIEDYSWITLENKIKEILEVMIDGHDPDFEILDEEEKRKRLYKDMPQNIRNINDILDRTVRTYLQMDGGDIQVLKYDEEEKKVYVKYEGACGGCPISMTGTLNSIEGILQSELDSELSMVVL